MITKAPSALLVQIMLLATISPLLAETRAIALPTHEHIVYARTVGDTHDSIDIDISLKSDKKASWYEYISKSADETGTYRLDPENLDVLWSDVTTRSSTLTVRRITEVLENKTVTKADEVVIGAGGPFQQQLRLLHFAEKQKYKVSFQGSGTSNPFSLELAVVGREMISVGGVEWDCWKLQFGMGGIFGGLVGKSNYWYSATSPNLLVRSSGPSSFPGSPLTTLEIMSYSGPSGAFGSNAGQATTKTK